MPKTSLGGIASAPIVPAVHRVLLGVDTTRLAAMGQSSINSPLASGGQDDSFRVAAVVEEMNTGVAVPDELKITGTVAKADSGGSTTSKTGGTVTLVSTKTSQEVAQTAFNSYLENKMAQIEEVAVAGTSSYSNTSSSSSSSSSSTTSTRTAPRITYAERKMSYLEDNF